MIQDLCEAFRFPYEEIKADVDKLLELCEKQTVKPKLSKKAEELLQTAGDELFTRTDLQERLMWNHMAVKRAINELLLNEYITQISNEAPYEYQKV